jgi:membrane-associated phospholipid phosphatase
VTTTVHRHSPVTYPAATRYGIGPLVAAGVAFVALAIGAATDSLPWDEEINEWVLDHRSRWPNTIALRISFIGSTPAIIGAAVLLAFLAWLRCPRLALAILLLAAIRPLVEFTLKEIIDRPRPVGGRLVRGEGPSFPSGHPFAFALTWAFVPMVIALYTRRRALWRGAALVMWIVATMIAVSRVWLAVHWASDVVASLLLAVIVVSAAELVVAAHGCGCREVAEATEPSTGGETRVRAHPGDA